MMLIASLFGLLAGLISAPMNQLVPEYPGKSDTLKTWNITADKISTDPLGQYYIVNAGTLVKYDTKGDSAYSWSEPQSGRISSIDTGDPMRIMVYQKDFNLLRFLNNRLAPLSAPIRLDDLELTRPLALAISRQGGFWVLDGSTLRIRYIDQQLKTGVESTPLNFPPDSDLSGCHLIESGDQVLLLIPGREVQVFDLFANLTHKIPIKAPSFSVYGNRILLVYPDKIMLWKDPVTIEETLFGQSKNGIREACLNQNRLFIRTTNQVILLSL